MERETTLSNWESRIFHLRIGSRRRITLPAAVRKELGIKADDTVEIVVGKSRVEIRRSHAAKPEESSQ